MSVKATTTSFSDDPVSRGGAGGQPPDVLRVEPLPGGQAVHSGGPTTRCRRAAPLPRPPGKKLSIADHGRPLARGLPSGRGLLICHEWLGGLNSPKSHPNSWKPSVVDPQLPRNLEKGVSSRYNLASYRYGIYFHCATSVQDSLGVTCARPRVSMQS